MKITSIEVLPVRVPLAACTPEPVGGETSSSHTLVRVFTDEGVTGIGEVFRFAPRTVATFVDEILSPLLVGEDPARIEVLWDRMYRTTYRFGRMGMVMHAISGVEVALWDIAGKVAGLPLAQLLGGPCRDGLLAYASMHPYATPDRAAEAALALLGRGYRALKLHQKDVETTRAVREAVGPDVRLMLDASGAWSVPDAARAIDAMADLDLYWVEEPLKDLNDIDGLKRLRERAPMRIAAGENEYTHYGFREIIEKEAVDILQPDVIKCGGVSATRKVIGMAEAHGMEICLHSFCFGPGVAATLHVGLSSPRCEMIEIVGLDLERSIMTPDLRQSDGYVRMSGLPGLGIALDDAVLASARADGMGGGR